MVDCTGRMENECRLVQEDTKEQKSLNRMTFNLAEFSTE